RGGARARAGADRGRAGAARLRVGARGGAGPHRHAGTPAGLPPAPRRGPFRPPPRGGGPSRGRAASPPAPRLGEEARPRGGLEAGEQRRGGRAQVADRDLGEESAKVGGDGQIAALEELLAPEARPPP